MGKKAQNDQTTAQTAISTRIRKRMVFPICIAYRDMSSLWIVEPAWARYKRNRSRGEPFDE